MPHRQAGRSMIRSCLSLSAKTPARLLLVVALLAAAMVPAVEQARARRQLLTRLSRPGQAAPLRVDVGLAAAPGDPLLASWQTVGGCGAGSATGIGGIKWIGRNVTGGLIHVQTQGNYTQLTGGYSFALQSQLTGDLGPKWNL